MGIPYSSFFSSIDSLSDWHCEQIRKLCPRWTNFCSFLASFPNLRDGLSVMDIDRLLDQVYPLWDADPEYDEDGNICGYYERFITESGWKAVWEPAGRCGHILTAFE